jgi:hypothetical protein
MRRLLMIDLAIDCPSRIANSPTHASRSRKTRLPPRENRPTRQFRLAHGY